MRADEIYISKLVSLYDLDSPRDLDYFIINRLFYKCGGSWEKIFLGSCEDIKCLKKCLKQYYKIKDSVDNTKMEMLKDLWKNT